MIKHYRTESFKSIWRSVSLVTRWNALCGDEDGYLNKRNELSRYVNCERWKTMRVKTSKIFLSTLSRPFKTPLSIGYLANGQEKKMYLCYADKSALNKGRLGYAHEKIYIIKLNETNRFFMFLNKNFTGIKNTYVFHGHCASCLDRLPLKIHAIISCVTVKTCFLWVLKWSLLRLFLRTNLKYYRPSHLSTSELM